MAMYLKVVGPSIDEHRKGFPNFWLNEIFGKPFTKDAQVHALAVTYVRLVEAAIIEYHLGVEKISEYFATSQSINFGAAHRSVSHFESCLSNMYRISKTFRRLRRIDDPLPRALNAAARPTFATDAVASRFHQARHDVHHMEERITGDDFVDGQPYSLIPGGPEAPHPTEEGQTNKLIDRVTILDREITFDEIVGWLNEMGRFAQMISDFRSPE